MGKIVYLFGNPDDEKKNKKEPEPVEPEMDVPTYMEQFEQPMDLNETAVLYKLGSDKESGALNATWDEVAAMMNDLFRQNEKPETESSWRKRYVKIREEMQENPIEMPPDNVVDFNVLSKRVQEIEKARMRQRDERAAYTREVRRQAREEQMLDMFRETIKAYPEIKCPEAPKKEKKQKAIYAMLSDIHYGLTFNSYVGVYNTEIAKDRVLKYADEIVLAGKKEGAATCFVSLMGDMISGIIHPTIRVENKENAIEQIVGVAELVSTFLYYLSKHFTHVYVNSVDGNHSRLDGDLEKSLRKEKLDALIPWYCKAKLANQTGIQFVDAEFDNTVASFCIFDKLFVAVHGDLEKDLHNTAVVLEKAIGRHIDYLLAGHMHVPEMRAEDTMYIRNGSVCGSGDDYTMKKRLFSPPYQVFMVLDSTGSVESIHTIRLADQPGSNADRVVA